jgi:hypothetical protein
VDFLIILQVFFKGFGNVLGAIGKNILTFDFTDSNKRVKNAMSDLGSTLMICKVNLMRDLGYSLHLLVKEL